MQEENIQQVAKEAEVGKMSNAAHSKREAKVRGPLVAQGFNRENINIEQYYILKKKTKQQAGQASGTGRKLGHVMRLPMPPASSELVAEGTPGALWLCPREVCGMLLPLLPASPWPAKAPGCLIRVMSIVVLSLTVKDYPRCLLCVLAGK